MTFSTILGIREMFYSFILVLKGKTGEEIPESRLKFLENFSDAKDNTTGPLNREGIADLPLLRTLLAFTKRPKSHVSWN